MWRFSKAFQERMKDLCLVPDGDNSFMAQAERHIAMAKACCTAEGYERHYGGKTIEDIAKQLEEDSQFRCFNTSAYEAARLKKLYELGLRPHQFKAGDKVRIIAGTPEDLDYTGYSTVPIRYAIGDVLELVNDANTDSPYHYSTRDALHFVFVCFSHASGVYVNNQGQSYFRMEIERVELVPAERHKCHCPPQNFYWNGIGCQCGGK